MKNDLITILNPLEEQLLQVENEIRAHIYSGIPSIDGASRYIFDQGGKRIRASLVLLTAGLSGSIPAGAVKLGAASEILHAATLIHDDIIDQSILRRGNISVPQKWGNKIAVLLGDFLYTLALDLVLRVENNRIYAIMIEGTKNMVSGELYQLNYSNIDSITMEHYYKIIELKTARFMAACTKMGGEIGGFDESRSNNLYEFGMNIGFAFQIIDDTLDIMNDSDTIGKDVRSDVRSGKITLPFLHLMEREIDSAALLRSYISNPDDGKWEELMVMLRKSSVVDTCISTAKGFVEKALECLQPFEQSQYKEILVDISNFFIDRRF